MINLLIGNGLWTSILRILNVLPQSLTTLNIRSWYNQENGVISLFLTQNSLAQYLFTSYILIKLISQNIQINLNRYNSINIRVDNTCLA